VANNFVPQIWSTKILRTLEDNLVAKKICNTEYQGEIKKAGDTVHIAGLSDPTISTYSGSVSYESLKDAGVNLVIDQQKYFAFKVGDIEDAQSNIDKKGSQADRAAYMLRDTADSFILGKYGEANLSVTDASLDSATVISALGAMQQKLAEKNVSDSDMWLVIPPWIRLKLQLAGIAFQINNGINGSGGMAWTKDLGFDVFVTNQVVNTGTVDTPVSHVMAGSYNSIVYADQIIETQYFDKLEGSFDSAVRGLHVYGAKVVRPDLLVHGTFTYAAETAI
jgi:hypothetical protein